MVSILAAMFDGDIHWLWWVFWLGIVLPIVVTLVLAVLAWSFGKKWVSSFIEPDLPKLHEELEALRAQHPDRSDADHVQAIVQKQALKCGLVGAVTGFGGFVTLPIAIPIDLLFTARYQAAMVSFIAQVHGYEKSVENRAATYAVITGSTKLSKLSMALVSRYAPRILGKTFSKLVPVVGAAVGFGVNYLMCASTAKVADNWYRSQTREQMLERLKLSGGE